MTDWRDRRWTNLLLLGVIGAIVFCLALLGNWQLRRFAWKNNLVMAIETRASEAAVPAPTKDQWHSINADDHAYQRVKAEGTYIHQHERIVRTLTELGSGYWVLTPLVRHNGEVIWINRGFVLPDKRYAADRSEPEKERVTVIGLLRVSEPDGTLLQTNDPEQNRWYSRDVDALSRTSGLAAPAPFFIDVEASAHLAEWPRAGLTKLNFKNNHLQYALTWYAMALLLVLGTGYVAIWCREN